MVTISDPDNQKYEKKIKMKQNKIIPKLIDHSVVDVAGSNDNPIICS